MNETVNDGVETWTHKEFTSNKNYNKDTGNVGPFLYMLFSYLFFI